MKLWVAALVAAAAWAQDAEKPMEVTLAWKLETGVKLRMSWKSRLQQSSTIGGEALPKTDATLEIRAVLSVVEVPAGSPVVCEMRIDGYGLKGLYQGREIDAEFVNGEMKSVRGLPDGGEQMKKTLGEPFLLTLSARGEFKSEDQGRLSRVFAGESVWFGARLPDGPVAVGATWEEKLQTAQAKASGGPAFEVKRKLESIDSEGIARIVTDEEKDLDQMGMKVKIRITTEDRFDAERGFCARSRSSVKAGGGGEVQGRGLVVAAESTIELQVNLLAD
jgi:hypothetical protein